MTIYTIFASNPSKTYWSTEPSKTEAEILKENPLFATLEGEMRAQFLAHVAGDDVQTTPNTKTIESMTRSTKEWNLRVLKTREAKKIAVVEVLAGAQSEALVEEVRKAADLSPKELLDILTDGDKAAQTTLDYLAEQYKQNAAVAAARLSKGKKNKG